MQALFVLAVVAAVIVVFNAFFRRSIVFEYQRGLLYRRGRFIKTLGPGAYWHLRRSTEIRPIDVRSRNVTVPGQEVLSSDSVALKVSLVATFEVIDPAKAVNEVENYQEALYIELQTALREVVTAARVDELFEKRAELSKQVFAAAESKTGRYGLKLAGVSVKDITFPGELKKIFSQVVKAQKEGLAALEKARGETAALRNLANAARLIEENPALLQLRALHAMSEGSGNSVVFGMPTQGIPLPPRSKEEKPKTGE